MNFNFWNMLEASLYSTFRIVFIAFGGYLLVRFKIIGKPIMKGIADLTANFLIPCLSISEICKSFHIEDISMWLPILVCCVVNVSTGFLIGVISCKIIKPNSNEIKRLILIVFMFSNSTSMQLIYVDSLSAILGNLMTKNETAAEASSSGDCQTVQKDSATAIAKSQGYMIVLIYTIFVTFLRWSIGYNLMKPDLFSRPLRDDLEFASGKSAEEAQAKREANERSPINDTGNANIQYPDVRLQPRTLRLQLASIAKLLKVGINMPFISGFAAIFLTSMPYIGKYISRKDSLIYKLIVESCSAVGSTVSTFVILMLGLNLSLALREPFNREKLSSKLIILVIVIKSTLIPLLGIVLIYYLGYLTGFIGSPLLCFLLLTNFCTPTAINMITIAIINKFQINNLSRILIYQYLVGSLTVTIWTAIYLNLFS